MMCAPHVFLPARCTQHVFLFAVTVVGIDGYKMFRHTVVVAGAVKGPTPPNPRSIKMLLVRWLSHRLLMICRLTHLANKLRAMWTISCVETHV